MVQEKAPRDTDFLNLGKFNMAVVGPGPGAKSVDDLTFDLSFTLLFCKEYIAYNRDFNQK